MKEKEMKVRHILKNGKVVDSIKGKTVKVDPKIFMRKTYK